MGRIFHSVIGNLPFYNVFHLLLDDLSTVDFCTYFFDVDILMFFTRVGEMGVGSVLVLQWLAP